VTIATNGGNMGDNRPSKRVVVDLVRKWLTIAEGDYMKDEVVRKKLYATCPWKKLGDCKSYRYLCYKIFPKLKHFPEGAGSPCPCTFIGVETVVQEAREFVGGEP
jgi:hypothetical protein